jgi:5-hydroxyisourate hydrolase
MNGITTHVLDVSAGKPAAGISVRLERKGDAGWKEIGTQTTDDDGRARELLSESEPTQPGIHRLTFQVGKYFNHRNVDSFYEEVTITFVVNDASQHYHVPLLLSPFGYSTYRGS